MSVVPNVVVKAPSSPTNLTQHPPVSAARTADALLTPREVAAKLGISFKVLEKWRASGEGPAVMRLTSKTLRYHLDDVEAFIASRRAQAAMPDEQE